MEATFKVKADEFDAVLIEKIKGFLSLVEDGYVTVSIRENASFYSDKLLKSKNELEGGQNRISFTMEELEEYITSKK